MGRSVSTTTSNNVILTAFSNIAQNDAVAIGPKGLAYKVSASDTAAVSNITYGTAQTTAATGRILAQTQINSATQNLDAKRHAIVQLADKSLVIAATTAGATTGLRLLRYSLAGALLGSVALDTSANNLNTPRLFLLTSGNICVVYSMATTKTVSFAILDPSLNVVKAVTTVEAERTPGQFDAVPLTGGGFAVSYQQLANTALHRLAIYDNTGTVVSAAATIQTWTGTAGDVYTYMTALSNGGVAIACSSAYTTTVGTYYGVWSATGVQVQSMTQISAFSAGPQSTYITALPGFFAVYASTGAGAISIGIYSNAGVVQGAPYTNTASVNLGWTSAKLLSDGTNFWSVFSASTATLYMVKLPTTGTNYVATSITTSGISNYNLYLDAFYENGYIVGMSTQTGAAANFLWVADTATRVLVGTANTLFGVAAGTDNSGTLPALIPIGDYAFAALYEYISPTSLNLTLGKYANTSVIGVSSANALANATVPVQQTAGAYYCNTVLGTTPELFDNSSTNIYGNKGTFLTNSIVLKGL